MAEWYITHDWYYIFDDVRRIIDPEIGVFRIYVRHKNGTLLGSNGPFFSSISPEECSSTKAVNQITTTIEIFLNIQRATTKEEVEKDVFWEVVSEKLGILPLNTCARIVPKPPRLIAQESKHMRKPSTSLEATRQKLKELMSTPISMVPKSLDQVEESKSSKLKAPWRFSIFENCHKPVVDKLVELDQKLYPSVNIMEAGLYKHQVEALLSMNGAFLDGNRATVALPTGSCKSMVVVLAPYVLKSRRTMVITPSRIISKQLDQAFVNALHRIEFFDGRDPADYLPRDSPFAAKNAKELAAMLNNDDKELVIVNAHQIQKSRTTIKIGDLPPDRHDLIIVDEAHHYRAETWRNLIDHFKNTRLLFLTATLPEPCPPGLPSPCNEHVSRKEYERFGILRQIDFQELESVSKNDCFRSIADRVIKSLENHDMQEKSIEHQAIILALNSFEALAFKEQYQISLRAYGKDEKTLGCRCILGRGDSEDDNSSSTLLDDFKQVKFRTIVVIHKAIEGFDHSNISVVALVRGCRSRIVFEQIIGRACRTNLGLGDASKDVKAIIISHSMFDQRKLIANLDAMATDRDEGDDEDEELEEELDKKERDAF